MKVKFAYALPQDTAVLMVRYWPFDRCFAAESILLSRNLAPDTWLKRLLG